TRARGSVLKTPASNEPRPPTPIRRTEIFEFACDPRTDSGRTMVKPVAAAAPASFKNFLREKPESACFMAWSPLQIIAGSVQTSHRSEESVILAHAAKTRGVHDERHRTSLVRQPPSQ